MCGGHDEHVLGGNDDVLGERARPGDADAGVVVAELAAPALAVAAMAARDVALAGDSLTDLEADDVGAELLDLAHELVTDHHRHGNRRLRPRIPVEDVQVGAADRRLAHPDQHVAVAGRRLGHVLEPQPGFASWPSRAPSRDHPHRSADPDERVDRLIDVVVAVRRRHLRADACLALRHDRKRERDHVDPFVSSRSAISDGDSCVAEHHRDDRVAGTGEREAGRVHALRGTAAALRSS